MFLPSFKKPDVESPLSEVDVDRKLVGWTAFIPGTHQIDAAKNALGNSTLDTLQPHLDGKSLVTTTPYV
jgi:hypothetical protein